VFAPFLGQQEKFFAREERTVFFGGAAGGGKSLCLLMKWMRILKVEMTRYAEAKREGRTFKSVAWGIYFRRTTPDLEQIKNLSEIFFKAADPDAHFQEQKGIWTFPNAGDAKFQFAHLEHEKDKLRHKSREYVYIAWDELTLFTETQFDYLDTRLRTGDPVLEPLMQVCAASNPDGEGLLWVRRRFVKIAEPERVVRQRVRLRDGRIVERDQVFIPARLDDNPVLMESGQYEATLIGKTPELRQALLEGNWDLISGTYLAEFWEPDRHVIKPHLIPPTARLFRSCQLGIKTPTSIGYFYMDEQGAMCLFAHFRFVNRTPSYISAKLQAYETRIGTWDERRSQSKLNSVRNPLCVESFGKGESAGVPTQAKEFLARGFRWKRAKQGPGWRRHAAAQIVSRLASTVMADFEGADSVTTMARPMLRFVDGCRSPVETIPAMVQDRNDADDVSEDQEQSDWVMLGIACLEKPVNMAEDEEEDDDFDEDEPAPNVVHDDLILGAPIP